MNKQLLILLMIGVGTSLFAMDAMQPIEKSKIKLETATRYAIIGAKLTGSAISLAYAAAIAWHSYRGPRYSLTLKFKIHHAANSRTITAPPAPFNILWPAACGVMLAKSAYNDITSN